MDKDKRTMITAKTKGGGRQVVSVFGLRRFSLSIWSAGPQNLYYQRKFDCFIDAVS